MTDYKRLFHQTLWIYLFTFLILPVSFFLRILYANKLSVVDYGIFYGLFAFFGLFGLFRDFGLNAASTYFSHKYLVEKDTSKVKTLFFLNQSIQFGLSLIIGAVLFLLRKPIITKFYHDEGHVSFMFSLFIVWWIIKTLRDSNIVFFTIFQEQKTAKLFEFSEQSLLLLLSFFGFFFMAEYLVPVYAYIIVTVFIAILSFFFLIKNKKYLLLDPLYKKPDLYKEVILYALAFLPASFSIFVLSQTDALVLQFFKGAETVAYYSSGLSVSMILFLFIGPISVILPPLLARLWHEKKNKELTALANFLLNNVLLFLLPFSLFFFVFAEQLIGLLFGQLFLPGIPVLQLFSITMIFSIVNHTFLTVLGSLGQPKTASYILLFGALLNLVLDIALVISYGMMGVAVATSLSYVILMSLSLKATAKHLPLRFDLLNNLKVIVASSLFILTCLVLKGHIWVFESAFPKLNFILNAGLVFVIALALYVVALLALGVITKEKVALVRSLFKGPAAMK